ncbi:N-acetylglucosaminyltransferase II [Oesophagostomum dentatum]|uniref:Alpha-1,6-mannosyl-glycoprotein 2-beta-N-acetylglucosaminyltransferase n=1 Tax=Oesophagostomum dentatum TaxID=61180 RepID=A0A0B1T2L1_OESDE|nr:N-acetylglucosaminyltransferase II [Oesophagostomum dentatum]
MLHRRWHKILNIVISICLIGFIVVIMKGPSSETILMETPSFPSLPDVHLHVIKEMEADLTNDSIVDYGSTNANLTISGQDIVSSVNFLNENFEVLNLAKFGPIQQVKFVVVIQVHNRPTYLGYLIESLRTTRGIEEVLLVFSHDINIASINEMIRNITFARVLQIFYPYNIQLFPHVFPGQDPRDCPERVGKDAAKAMQCQNFEHPDKYGNYRVAKIAQIKHHWWWKMNYVFDGIYDRYKLSDPWVLLLEEDHYLAPDALHVLEIIIQNRKTYCDKCEIISLGFYLKTFTSYGNNIAKLGAHPWYSSKHNMGMAFRRETWTKVKNCSELFCKYDDYNWDWSLMQVVVKCLPERFRVIFTKSPRVIHIGDYGVHTHRRNAHNAYISARDIMTKHANVLFPLRLAVTDVSTIFKISFSFVLEACPLALLWLQLVKARGRFV